LAPGLQTPIEPLVNETKFVRKLRITTQDCAIRPIPSQSVQGRYRWHLPALMNKLVLNCVN